MSSYAFACNDTHTWRLPDEPEYVKAQPMNALVAELAVRSALKGEL